MKQTIGFIGAGNMCQAILEGWLNKQLTTPQEIFVSNRTPGKLQKMVDTWSINACSTNEMVVDKSEVVVLSMKPQDLESAIEGISSSFQADQVVISLAAGISLQKLKKLLPQCKNLVRLMANTPARIQRGCFGYCTTSPNLRVDRFMEIMFKPLGLTLRLEEGDLFQAFSVASSAGVGFIFELMIYWQEWLEEHGLDEDVARELTIHTFAGTAELALQSGGSSLNDLQAKVTSKKGITAAGLDSMRELEIERLLRYSFEKAALRDTELGN
ncbi:MAG: pyrroline-5-carboxylate reductase family protein [Bdellovibrionales bacterium]